MEKDSYHYNKEPEPYRLLKVKNIHFRAHFHPQIEIVYCVKGTQTILIDGLSYILEEGDGALIFPNQRHYYQPSAPDTESISYLLLFYPTDTNDYYREWNFFVPVNPVVKKEQMPDSVSKLWDLFYESYRENSNYQIFKAYAGLLTAHIMPILELQPVESGYDPEDIQIVLNYVNQHFREDITLKSVAKALGFHPNHLSAFFNKKIGYSFTSHVRALRIENARHLLKATCYSVNEIRVLSGFQSNRTFFRCFREKFGMSPLEYREVIEKKGKS